MGFAIDGKLRVFATPKNMSKLYSGAIPRGDCWPGRFDDSSEIADTEAHVASASPEYYILRYAGLNDLTSQVKALLQTETWVSGSPPVRHRNPCLEVLELNSHANRSRAGGICDDNLQQFAAAVESLRYCDGLAIYLSGCNTGLRGGIAEKLALSIPSAVRRRQYRCVVFGARGYLSGTNAGKNSEVSKTYEAEDGKEHAALGPDAANAKRDPSSPQDESYQGYKGPNSA